MKVVATGNASQMKVRGCYSVTVLIELTTVQCECDKRKHTIIYRHQGVLADSRGEVAVD